MKYLLTWLAFAIIAVQAQAQTFKTDLAIELLCPNAQYYAYDGGYNGVFWYHSQIEYEYEPYPNDPWVVWLDDCTQPTWSELQTAWSASATEVYGSDDDLLPRGRYELRNFVQTTAIQEVKLDVATLEASVTAVSAPSMSAIAGLEEALDLKADLGHVHEISETVGLSSALHVLESSATAVDSWLASPETAPSETTAVSITALSGLDLVGLVEAVVDVRVKANDDGERLNALIDALKAKGLLE